MIFDPAGQIAGSVPVMPARFATGDPAGLALFLQKIQINVRESQQVIRAALANEQDLAKLVSTQADGQTLAAVPMLDHRQSVSGVLLVAVRGLSNVSSPLSNLFPWLPEGGSQQLSTLLPYVLLLILVVSVIGTLVGMLTARRITRRLQRITSAAHAWSRGDFQVHVSDRSPDELGQLAQDLNRMALQVQHLLKTRQQLASLEERQRVARDLHDSVKQQAFALTLLIGAAQSRLPDDIALAQGSLRKAGELVDQIRQELTVVLQQLRPIALVGQGLQTALRDSIRQWSQQTGVACEFQASEAPEMPVLHPEIEEALFRVAQEALANVARHSQASQVWVQLEQGTEQVRLHISDNGKGFAVEQAAGSGHGLSNMRDRVEAYGGTLHISSAPGETVVAGCIPLAQKTQQRRNRRKGERA
jgi:two-component system, NarL family, sensor histidine kinase LiaS